ncbi:PREDICTED: replication protein A 32 kDa subunit A [Tarenaya hassleriana]|uniref:replication protein A 32 kDa subunit A n=1 Tax=Tarenaya hassleriana TaxID=28532 RepID=UPI00053C4B39|nr:PREDICTED: replication protein A 32 kDa subunit A [Tarenaya hassleriana]
MFSGSQFEPNSAFSGGGFMSSQPSQAYDSSPSTAKNREFQGLVPVTVKQIMEAFQSGGDKSGLVINDIAVTNVTLVGLVFEKNDTKFTEVSFALDDGTGKIDCKRWVNEAFDTREMEMVKDGTYVRLNGHLKSFQGKKQLLVFSVRPITDFNEVTFHYIECIHFYSRNSKSQQVGSVTQSPMANSSVNATFQGGSNTIQAASSNHVSSQNEGGGRKNLDEMILDYLKQPSCTDQQQGIHLDEISQQLKIPKNKLENVIHSLESDGLIYSTIDEFHFKHVEL